MQRHSMARAHRSRQPAFTRQTRAPGRQCNACNVKLRAIRRVHPKGGWAQPGTPREGTTRAKKLAAERTHSEALRRPCRYWLFAKRPWLRH